ncbi:MAG: sigma 54-interacting transcriptional regulator [Terracidiphilus sp.]
MPIQCALFSRDNSPVRIEIESPSVLPKAVGTERLPAAVVVRAKDLEVFGECTGLFKDHNRKDEHKGLSEYLLGKSKQYLLGQGKQIPFVAASFTSGGRMKQGIDILLANAGKAGESGIYLLGVGEELFLQLWSGARSEDDSLRPASHGNRLADLIAPLPGEAQLTDLFWGRSEAYHEVRQLILRAARISAPVLILGDAGTGKEVVARAIHSLGEIDKPFIPVNCAALQGELFELELFGYAAGALPGGLLKGKAGQWETAGGGTLFLDEIGCLRLDNQEKILHALQEGFVRRVGASANTPVSARVIAASRNLWELVQRGQFLEDLYYLMRQFLIRTPDLRGDPRNVEVISQKLWREITNSDARLPQEILDDLCRHRWPGNVRELRSVLSFLHNLFDASAPTRKQLNMVFQQFGLAAGYGQRAPGAGDPALLQVECLRMICRADDAIHACEQELKPLAAGLPLSAAAHESLARIREEMQALMRDRLYFGSHETYQAVARVEESLGKLLEPRKKDLSALLGLWQENLAPEIHRAVVQLFAEIQKLRESMGARA